jgi:hypothetical protein
LGLDKARKTFFFEKKEQKTFAPGGVCGTVPMKPKCRLGLIGTESQTPPEQKFFGYFFPKK